MAVKNFRQKFVAFVAGVLIGPAIVYAGLESATYISDLVASNPLSSDLKSTADDHIRLLKSTIKTTFPNINGAVTATDEQLNTVITNVAANPTGTIGLSAVNGTAATYLRSDGAPALSQAISPTWTAQHIFSKTGGGSDSAIYVSAVQPGLSWNESGAAANNRRWDITSISEQLRLRVIDDANSVATAIMTVDRTGTTVDRITFPTVSTGALLVGVAPTTPSADQPMLLVNTNAARSAVQFENTSATAPTVYIGSDQTGGNSYVSFYDGGDPDTATGSITTNGTTTAYNTTSDARLKKNFRPSPSARRVIDCIQVESYDWKQGGQHVHHGVVAQRLNKCAPYAVTQGKIWQVDQSKLVPALIKYVQEQDARIADLERRLH